jgi:thioesterase domain-containing protein
MPLSSNGKIDRAALHDIAPQISSGEAEFLAPRDNVEEELKRIWVELLGFPDVGIKNNFFQIGGHSLTAIVLANRIAKSFNKKVTARLIFERPTIEQQAVFLRGEVLGAAPEHRSLVPIQPEGSLRPIFCVHPFFGLAYCYKELSSLLGNNQPFFGLQSSGLEEGESALKTIPEMAASYVKAITVIQPSGPYQLAGWSMGALVAYEMAQQLLAAGQQVSFLGLMEGYNIEPAQPASSVLAPEEWNRRVIEQEEKMVVDLMKEELGFTDDQLSGMSQKERSLEYLAKTSNTLFRNLTVPQARRLLRVATINQLAVEVYRPQPYPGTATLFRIPLKPGDDASCGWSRVVEGGLTIFEIPGTHHGFMSGTSVALIAAQLKSVVMPLEAHKIG